MIGSHLDHVADCSPLSSQIQKNVDELTVLDQLLYTAAQAEYAKVQRRKGVPLDSV